MTDDTGLTRRDFARLAAATGVALTLPGQATGDATSGKFDADYEYVLNHTPVDHAVPTLVRFADDSQFEAFRELTGDAALTTAEPEPAGYAKLTGAQAIAVAELPTAETLSHSPGSNPFWRIGYYPFGVFPEPHRSTEFIDYEQMVDGLHHLESQHNERMNVYSVGQSPGHYNEVSARTDPKDLYVAEVTNNIDEESFREKTKIMYSLSMHGLERAGAEAGSRFIEGLLRGTEGSTEKYLDDVVLIFVYPNPDGWVAKHPQYESGWQLAGPDGGAPVAPFYERGTAKVFDTNRQYPTVGWIDPSEYPAEPDGANLTDDDPNIDQDVPEPILEHVPDTLSFVEHFRKYENLEYGADLHGALHLPEFVLGLISQHQFSNQEFHELYQMNERIDEVLEEALDTWTTAGDAKQAAVGDRNAKVLYEALPEEAFDYGGVWDTIGYTDAGFFGDWMAHPEELGGLGLTSMDFEMAYSHMVGSNAYDPELVDMQVTGYRTAIRAIAEFATKDVTSEVEVGEETVGYVTTNTLRRSYEDLSFVDPASAELEEVDSRIYTGTIGPGGPSPASTTATHTFDTADLDGSVARFKAELSWTPSGEDLEFELRAPDGSTVARAASANNPEAISGQLEQSGEYTFVVETWANVVAQYEIDATFTGFPDGGNLVVETTELSLSAGDTAAASHTVDTDADTLSVNLQHAPGVHARGELSDPSGEVVRSFDPSATERGATVGFPRFVVNDPDPGEWTLSVTGLPDADAGDIRARFGTLGSDSPNPNPSDALGYEQRDYGTVDPMTFFEEFDEALTGKTVALSVDDVAKGKASDVDHLVVIHDDGVDDADYVDALDAFVEGEEGEDGGNLVLTDTGVHLLGAMNNYLAAEVSTEENDIVDEELYLGYVGSFPDESVALTDGDSAAKNSDHPLLESTRPIQKQLYKIVPLGYNVGFEAPMTNIDPAAFERSNSDAVDATVAATVEGTGASGKVGLGSFVPAGAQSPTASGTGIHVIGGLLPPATQANLHPFGLLDYTISFFGEQVLTNALGGKQVRYVDGEVVAEFGSRNEVESPPTAPGEESLTVEGSREDDGSTFTAGQTNQVDITATPSKSGVVRDTVPDGWKIEHTKNARVEEDDGTTYVVADATADEEVEFTYFAEAPEETGEHVFGPVEAVAGDEVAEASGTTESNYVVGVDQNGPESAGGSAADGTGGTLGTGLTDGL